MEISGKTLFFFLLAIGGYIYLSDVFNKPNLQNNFLGVFNGTNHTLFEFIANRSNSMAAIISGTSAAILNSLPVITAYLFTFLIISYYSIF